MKAMTSLSSLLSTLQSFQTSSSNQQEVEVILKQARITLIQTGLLLPNPSIDQQILLQGRKDFTLMFTNNSH